MSNPTQNISGINNSFDAFQPPSPPEEDISQIMKAFNVLHTPLLTDENSSSDPIERLTKRIVARETQSCMREWEEATRSDRIYDLENLSKELSDVSKELSALSPSADSSPAIAKLQGRVLDVLSTCNEMQNALQNAVTDKVEATLESNQKLLIFNMQLANFLEQLQSIL